MHREDFGAWGAGLKDEDFWKAVLLLGAFGAANHPNPSEEDVITGWQQWIGPFLEAPAGQDRSLPWLVIDEAEAAARDGRTAPAKVLSALWDQLKKEAKLPERVESLALYDNQQELEALLHRLLDVSLYMRLPLQQQSVNWQWPIRFGFLDNPQSTQVGSELHALQNGSSVLPNLMHVSSVRESSVFEFLVLTTGLAGAIESLDECPTPVRGHCVLLFDSKPIGFDGSTMSHLENIQRRTLATGIVLVDIAEGDRAKWLASLMYELSHDRPLDRALCHVEGWNSCPVMFFDPRLLDMVRIGRYADRLTRALKKSIDAVDLDPHAAGPLNLPAGTHKAETVGESLRSATNRQAAFASESGGATLTMAVQKALRGSGGLQGLQRTGAAAAQDASQERGLQVNVFEGETPAEYFRAKRAYQIETWIGHRKGMLTGAPIPEDLLPQEEDGHLLTVTFFAPGFTEEPEVQLLFLPRTGDSEPCSFRVTTNNEHAVFEGRFTIAYKNRVLRTYLLRGSVVRGTEIRSEDQKIAFTSEMATQSAWEGLSGQRAYGASIVINQMNGEHRASVQAGYHALNFSLTSITEGTAKIEAWLDGAKWDAPGFEGIEGKDTEDLLRKLARHGRTILDAVLDQTRRNEAGQILRDLILKADPVQVLAANLDARLPVELFYSLPMPESDATLCPGHNDALRNKSCASCGNSGDTKHVCPLGFWCLSKVIEWHDFDSAQDYFGETPAREFALEVPGDAGAQSDRVQLRRVCTALVAVSDKAAKWDPHCVTDMLERINKAGLSLMQVSNRDQWKQQVKKSPPLLILVPHTELDKDGLECMEISGDLISSGDITQQDYVTGAETGPGPIVLLIGCNTDNLGVPFRNFSVVFARRGASVVVSTVSQVLGRHAAPLAAMLVEAIVEAQTKSTTITFGELMRDVRRRWLSEKRPPIALSLKCCGDARWRL